MTADKGAYEHDGRQLVVTRTSPDSVTVGLDCGDPDHVKYIVGRIEGDRGWGVGRKESGHPHEGDFSVAVEHCAAKLVEECDSLDAIKQVDEFFSADVIHTLNDRLGALAGFLPKFESSDFDLGHMTARPGEMPYYSYSEEAMRFIEVCYDLKWVHPFDWGE